MAHAPIVHPHPGPVGRLGLVAGPDGLREIRWPDDLPPMAACGPAAADADRPLLRAAARQLDAYFAGERDTFELALDLDGTDFQRAVWRALAAIACGTTTSYGALAAAIGRPGAARAVGAAVAANPVPIVLPCHRVLRSDGRLGGFAAGPAAKRWLLEHEGAAVTRRAS